VALVVLNLQRNGEGVIIPLCTAKIFKLLHIDPSGFPLSKMVVHMSLGHVCATELKNHLGNNRLDTDLAYYL
jgi:hypothetical protein